MNGCYLLDTHTLLWATGEPGKLSGKVHAIIEEPSSRILVSHAVVWELSIKLTIGKIVLPADYFESLVRMGYEMLDLRDEHFAAYRKLPLLHRDPFDRILVAQAQSERIPILSADSDIARYDVSCIW